MFNVACDLYRFLSDDDDGVSEAIVPFAVQYIGILKVTMHSATSLVK